MIKAVQWESCEHSNADLSIASHHRARSSSLETLLEAGFTPRRTIVVASGIDEEASRMEGAGALAGYLEETYGKDGFAMLVDEGGKYFTAM